jgi:hypothetical protein
MARPAFSASLFSVDLVSSGMGVSPLRFDPRQHFVLTEAPVFSEPVTRQSFYGSLAHPPVNPRDWNLQHRCYFVDSKKTGFFPAPFESVACTAALGELNEDSSEDSKRGACCLEDAVFSRTANWGEWDFMLLRSLFECVSLNWFMIVIGCVWMRVGPPFELAVFPEE